MTEGDRPLTQEPPGDQPTGAQAGPPPGDALTEYGELLRLYSEAMVDIGRMEAQIGALTSRLEAARRDDVPPAAAKVSQPGSDSAEASHVPGAAQGNPDEEPRDVELRQMRLQIASLSNQLANAEDELEQTTGHLSARRRRRARQWPWWKRVASRLPFGGRRP